MDQHCLITSVLSHTAIEHHILFTWLKGVDFEGSPRYHKALRNMGAVFATIVYTPSSVTTSKKSMALVQLKPLSVLAPSHICGQNMDSPQNTGGQAVVKIVGFWAN